jgi:acyl carrier protein
MASTAQGVLEIVAAHSRRDVSKISTETTLGELGIDSLDVLEIVFAIEEAYDIALPFGPESASESGLGSIGDLVRMVDDLISRPRSKVA